MNRKIINVFNWLLIRILGNKFKIKILDFLFLQFRIDPLIYSLNKIGILKYQDDNISGESFLIKDVLSKYILENDQVIIFDVGANVGNYTKKLVDSYSQSLIYSFEPSQASFAQLSKRFKCNPKVTLENVALGSVSNQSVLYSYDNDPGSEHASLFSEVLQQLHGVNEIGSQKVQVITLDEYCLSQEIKRIKFLKIDTEGNELDVLRGANKMIDSDRIDLIQFEFNEMNVISRVFLKDFYSFLSNKYSIYRLDSRQLIPLPYYDTLNEIFKFQNFLAINKKLVQNV